MITSTQNNKVKQWQKLKKRKNRMKTNTFIVEGFHLVEEAFISDWKVLEVIVTEDTDLPDRLLEMEVTTVSAHVYNALTETQTPQGIAAVVEMQQPVREQHNKLLLVDAVQDPGNLGTLIRTADAAGFDGVVLGKGTVDLFNDKVIRATQGSLFHLPIYEADLSEEIKLVQEEGFEVFASSLDNAEDYSSVIIPAKVALLVGNEGAGVDTKLISQADKCVIIPIYGKAESLNVSVASGILMYHFVQK